MIVGLREIYLERKVRFGGKEGRHRIYRQPDEDVRGPDRGGVPDLEFFTLKDSPGDLLR